MSYASSIVASPWSRHFSLSLIVDAWRGITRREIVVTALLGLALYVLHLGNGVAMDLANLEIDLQTLFIAVADQIRVFSVFLAVVVANEWVGRDPDRRGVYTFAVIVGALPGAVLSVVWMTVMSNLFVHPADHPARMRPLFMIYMYLDMVMLFGAVIWVIKDRERAQRARAIRDRAERERLEAERRSIESDLQAMQARVEPQFLFNTLAQVKDLYTTDPTRGERMLDELIAYLRAAMPKMRDTASTAGQELDLARAYLNIVCLRLGERFAFTIDLSSDAADVRMPPMLVLPLLDHAIAHGYADARRRGMLAIRCWLNDQTLSLRVADTASAYLPEHETASLHGLHERLAALFGKHAVLELASIGSGGTQALLDIPAVPVPPTRARTP